MKSSTLDSLFPDQSFQFVKMDVQGAELAAIRGGSRVLAGAMFLLLELPWYGMYNEGTLDFAAHIATLDEAGFVVYVPSCVYAPFLPFCCCCLCLCVFFLLPC